MVALWLGKTNEGNGWYHTSLVAKASCISKLHIVRYKKFERQLYSDKILYHTFQHKGFFKNKFLSIFAKGFYVLRKTKVDFIVTFNAFPYGLISYVLSRINRVPLVLCFIGTDYNYFFQKQPYRFFLRLACRSAKIIICKGSHMITGFKKAGINEAKIKLYPHFVADRWFEKQTKSSFQYDIVTIGELIELKQFDVLIKAVKLLKDENVNVKACIIGDGQLKYTLIELAGKLGVHDQIEFAGFQDDVLKYLENSRLYVQTSKSEGLSLALVEALAAGVAPITTFVGSEKDLIIDGHNGLRIKSGDHQDLATKIKFLFDDANYYRLSLNVKKEANKFRMDNAVRSMNQILLEIKK